jgi:hypothetical protein
MISSGKLSKVVTMKAPDGRIEARAIEQEGPIAYIETTTVRESLDENSNRMLILPTTETAEQTSAILVNKAATASGTAVPEATVNAIKLKHQAAQSMLQASTVIIPFARYLMPPAERLVSRRQFDQLLAIVTAVVLLRQFQKVPDGTGRLVADLTDYAIAYEILPAILAESNGRLSAGGRTLLEVVRARFGGPLSRPFIAAEVETHMPLSRTEINNRLRELTSLGFIERTENGRGLATHYQLGRSPDGTSTRGLPTPDELAVLQNAAVAADGASR